MKKDYLLGGGVIISVILSIVAICRTYPLFVELSSIGIIFAAMSVVVTALIGSQIIQYLQVEKRMNHRGQILDSYASIWNGSRTFHGR